MCAQLIPTFQGIFLSDMAITYIPLPKLCLAATAKTSLLTLYTTLEIDGDREIQMMSSWSVLLDAVTKRYLWLARSGRTVLVLDISSRHERLGEHFSFSAAKWVQNHPVRQ
jgi:hypothetical protein